MTQDTGGSPTDQTPPEPPEDDRSARDAIGGFFLGCGGGILVLVALLVARLALAGMVVGPVAGVAVAVVLSRARRPHTAAGVLAAVISVLVVYGGCMYLLSTMHV